jgi:hypothetical protein
MPIRVLLADDARIQLAFDAGAGLDGPIADREVPPARCRSADWRSSARRRRALGNAVVLSQSPLDRPGFVDPAQRVACFQPWPCIDAKHTLYAEFAGRRTALVLYLASCLDDTSLQLTSPDGPTPAELQKRFLGWLSPPP